jgi:hypothetical protein
MFSLEIPKKPEINYNKTINHCLIFCDIFVPKQKFCNPISYYDSKPKYLSSLEVKYIDNTKSVYVGPKKNKIL